MREAMTTAGELVSFACIVVGVFLVLGLGVGLIVAGVLGALTCWLVA